MLFFRLKINNKIYFVFRENKCSKNDDVPDLTSLDDQYFSSFNFLDDVF